MIWVKQGGPQDFSAISLSLQTDKRAILYHYLNASTPNPGEQDLFFHALAKYNFIPTWGKNIFPPMRVYSFSWYFVHAKKDYPCLSQRYGSVCALIHYPQQVLFSNKHLYCTKCQLANTYDWINYLFPEPGKSIIVPLGKWAYSHPMGGMAVKD